MPVKITKEDLRNLLRATGKGEQEIGQAIEELGDKEDKLRSYFKDTVRHIIENEFLSGKADLIKDQQLDDESEARRIVEGQEEQEGFLDKVIARVKETDATEGEKGWYDRLRDLVDPQWVILAGGPCRGLGGEEGRSKSLDIWFGWSGENNTIQLSRRYLLGSRKHIIVISPQLLEGVVKKERKDKEKKGVDITERLLFSIASFQDKLDEPEILEDLRHKFESNGITLGRNTTISIEEKSSTWQITDYDNGKKYIVRKEGDDLKILECFFVVKVSEDTEDVDLVNLMLKEKKDCFPLGRGKIEPALIDKERQDFWFGCNAILALQPIPDGPGGALRCARELLVDADVGGKAKFLGVQFGDEPFLSTDLLVRTYLDHFLQDAGITLAGKKPETVIDKGAIFFRLDSEVVVRTKEWREMTNEDKQYMLNQQKKGEAYTLMGITLADRKLALEKLEDLELHRTSQNKTPQFHHVDLLTLFYEGYRGIYDLPQLEAENRKDEFRPYKTNCFKYDKFVFSGLNRWENLMDGVDYLYKENRRFLARKFRARVEPDAKVTIALSRDNLEPDIEIGEGCYFAGTIHLGRRVTIGDYCILKDVVLTNEVKVGNLVKLINVRADYTEFKSNTEPKWIDPILHTDTITGKIPMTNIRDCLLKNSKIGAECDLFDVDIRNTIIPERKRLRRVDIYNGLVRKGVIGERAEVSDWSINVKREFFSPGEYQRKQILTIPDISDFPREFVIL